jgi:ribosomal protein S18 acetylase RimI-like enzyme
VKDLDAPAVYRLMVEVLRCRDRIAPELPLYAKRSAHPLTMLEDPPELYDAMRVVINEVHGAYTQEYGAPGCSWRRVGQSVDVETLLREPHVQTFDTEPEDWTSPSALEYDEGPLHAVARAYKRECGWDTAPSAPAPHYAWVCVYEPLSGGYDEDAGELWFSGSLVGFAIVADRDDDGEPEALAHIWVARQARRAGHATRLLAEAERRFPALKTVEPPVTVDGRAFLAARSPRLNAGLSRG